MSTPAATRPRALCYDPAHCRQRLTSSGRLAAMTTDAKMINHLWTHKTQDHPFLSDEELVIDRAEGVWVWTERGKKLLDGFAGLAVVNVGHGRREIAEAIAEQTVRLAYYPTTRQFSNRPAAELAAKLAALMPGDLEYSFFAVSGAEANERAMQMARHYWLASGKPTKHKVISLEGGYHGGTTGTFAICGLPHLVAPYADLHVPGFAKIAPPYPFRDRGRGTDEELVQRRARELRQAIVAEGPRPFPTTPSRRTCTPAPTRRTPSPARRRSPTSRSWRRTTSWRTPRRWARASSTGSSRRWARSASSARCAAAGSWCAPSSRRPTARAGRSTRSWSPGSIARRGTGARSSTRAARS